MEEETRRRQRDANKIQELTKKVQRMENVFRENTRGCFYYIVSDRFS